MESGAVREGLVGRNPPANRLDLTCRLVDRGEFDSRLIRSVLGGLPPNRFIVGATAILHRRRLVAGTFGIQSLRRLRPATGRLLEFARRKQRRRNATGHWRQCREHGTKQRQKSGKSSIHAGIEFAVAAPVNFSRFERRIGGLDECLPVEPSAPAFNP